MEAAVTGPVHVDNPVDPVDCRTGREVRTLEELHVLQSIYLGRVVKPNLPILIDNLLDVELDCGSHLVEVVRRYLRSHPDSNPITAVEQQVGQARRQHGRLGLGIVEVGLHVDCVLIDVIQHVL